MFVTLLALCACAPKSGTPAHEVRRTPPPAAVDTIPSATPAPARVETREAARFRTLARDLPEHEHDPQHAAEVEALDALAAALVDLDVRYRGLEDEAERIRGFSQRIATSGPDSTGHAAWTRAALETAVDALEAVVAARPDLYELGERVQWAREAAADIDPAVPMLDQRGDVALAFSRLADALAYAAEVPAEVGARTSR